VLAARPTRNGGQVARASCAPVRHWLSRIRPDSNGSSWRPRSCARSEFRFTSGIAHPQQVGFESPWRYLGNPPYQRVSALLYAFVGRILGRPRCRICTELTPLPKGAHPAVSACPRVRCWVRCSARSCSPLGRCLEAPVWATRAVAFTRKEHSRPDARGQEHWIPASWPRWAGGYTFVLCQIGMSTRGGRRAPEAKRVALCASVVRREIASRASTDAGASRGGLIVAA
jgi:hypothetical protein